MERILIDCSSMQTASFGRGIGKYANNLIYGLLEIKNPVSEYILLFDANLPVPTNVLTYVRSKHQDVEIRYWKSLWGTDFADTNTDIEVVKEINRLNKLLYKKVVSEMNATKLVITSLFEGFYSLSRNYADADYLGISVIVIGYDTIQRQINLSDSDLDLRYKAHVSERYSELRLATSVMCISKTTIQDFNGVGFLNNVNPVPLYGGISKLPQKIFRSVSRSVHFCCFGNDEIRKNTEFVIDELLRFYEIQKLSFNLTIIGQIRDERILAKIKNFSKSTSVIIKIQSNWTDQQINEYFAEFDPLMILPSVVEGLDMPLLESMSSGLRMLISDIPVHREIVDWNFDGFFSPIQRGALVEALVSEPIDFEKYRISDSQLEQALEKFTWGNAAKTLIIETLKLAGPIGQSAEFHSVGKLAIVAPMPNQETGIADYVENQIEAILRYSVYSVEIYTESPDRNFQDDPRVKYFDPSKLRENYEKYDAVFYHLGNSFFHNFQIELIESMPGLIFLHDVNLDGWFKSLSVSTNDFSSYLGRLIEDAGYGAYVKYLESPGTSNGEIGFSLIKRARGVIVHNNYAKDLLTKMYPNLALKIDVIPLAKESSVSRLKTMRLRNSLNIPKDAILFSSFGMVSEEKMTLEIIEAFKKLDLEGNRDIFLLVIGEMHLGDYGSHLKEVVDSNPKIMFIDRVSKKLYNEWLENVDVSLQLRQRSKGETSGALLDCLAAGIPTIINAHGPNAEYFGNVCVVLEEFFSGDDLVKEMRSLALDNSLRNSLSENALEFVSAKHGYRSMWLKTDRVLKELDGDSLVNRKYQLVREISHTAKRIQSDFIRERFIASASSAVEVVYPPVQRVPRIYIDISASANSGRITGIERVTQNLLLNVLFSAGKSFEVIPVKLSGPHSEFYETAFNWMSGLYGTSVKVTEYQVNFSKGDILIISDFSGSLLSSFVNREPEGLRVAKLNDAKIFVLIHDLLPLTHPQFFPERVVEEFEDWFDSVTKLSPQFVVSTEWGHSELRRVLSLTESTSKILVNPFGSDHLIRQTANLKTETQCESFKFLMVGTLEPRKGYEEVLQVFDFFHNAGHDFRLTIVGREGWLGESTRDRDRIKSILNLITSSKGFNGKFSWKNDVSDQELLHEYESASYLIQASHAEGFGLPIVEARSHGIQVIARDIPVFREIAGDSITYFKDKDHLTEIVDKILTKSAPDIQKSKNLKLNDWKSFAEHLIANLKQ
jgi:glycosyltransferase involved in cell wall biosynthesis